MLVAPAQIRAFASAYALMEPCQSRWSGAMFRTAAASGCSDEDQCSWKLDSSTARTSYDGSRPAVSSGSPRLPAATVRCPSAVNIDASIFTVVVLPLVPVTASHGAAP